jgi:hypothetical protein
MSRIYFHSISSETEVLGMERAYCGCMISDIGLSILNLKTSYDLIIPLLHPDHYIQDTVKKNSGGVKENVIHQIETAIRISFSDEKFLVLDNKPINPWHLMLNTVLSIGSDTLRFMARLHAQCEIHSYVRGKNRNWLAGIIERGREEDILRDDVGWEDTVKMLRSNNKETVVLSYSVCDSFPNGSVADWEPPIDPEYDEPDWDVWHNLSNKKKWNLGLRGLLKKGHSLLEWKPDNWANVRFGEDGMTVFQLKKILLAGAKK